jgi:hypothetical protein
LAVAQSEVCARASGSRFGITQRRSVEIPPVVDVAERLPVSSKRAV